MIRRYERYRESGVEWLGVVPEHWGVKRLKENLAVKDGTHDTPQYVDIDNDCGTFPLVTSKDVSSGKLVFNKCNHISKSDYDSINKRSNVVFGDIIMPMIGSIGSPIIVDTTRPFSIKNLALLKNNISIINYFFCYYLSSQVTENQFEYFSSGGVQSFISLNTLRHIITFTPPLPEQSSIAAYLDTKTAAIDKKISLLEKKAESYRQLKQSLINETVTRGLDKKVKLKDSGVEWIGLVPEHWEVRRISDIATQNKTKNTGQVEKNLLSLSYGHIIRKDFDTTFGLLPESFESYQIVKQGYIILRLTDLQNDQRSLRVGLVREQQGIITSAYLGLTFCKAIYSTFAYYLLHVYDLCKVFYWFGGGLRSTMRFDDVKVIPFVLPPFEEQMAIADYLDQKSTQINSILASINTQIEKLKELRKTLINDVVTGKVKVV